MKPFRRDLPKWIRSKAALSWSLWAFACFNAAWAHRWQIANPMAVEGDAHRGLVWLPTLVDKTLFPNCIYIRFYAYMFSTLGHRSFFQLISLFADPIHARTLLVILLYGLSALAIFKVGEISWNRTAGVAAYVLFVVNERNFVWFQDGEARGFLIPATGLALYAILKNELRLIAIAFVVVALCHPLAFLSMYILFVLSTFGRFLEDPVWNKRHLGRFAINLFIPLPAIGIAIAYRVLTKPDFLGPIISLNEAVNVPFIMHYLDFVRPGSFFRSFFEVFTIPFPGFSHWECYLIQVMLGIGVIFSLIALRENKGPGRDALAALYRLLPACFIAYVIAAYLFPKLYYPDRQLMGLSLLSLMLSAIGWASTIRFLRWTYLPHVLLGVIGVTHLALLFAPDRRGLKANNPLPSGLVQFIQGLPKDTLIAAPPLVSEQIPWQCQRQVFFDPYAGNATEYPQFYQRILDREVLNNQWTHSTDLAQLGTIRRLYGVDYLILDRCFNRYPESPISPWPHHVNKIVSPAQAAAFFSAVKKVRKTWTFNAYTVVEL